LLSNTAYSLTADGFEGFSHYTYYGTTADNITLGWDQPDGFDVLTDDYEIELENPERNIIIPLIITLERQTTFKCSMTGHWIIRIRTRHWDGTEYKYSKWALSTDPLFARVNNEPHGWWIFAWIASTGPIEIYSPTGGGP